jgi:nitrate/nitrite transporter NarK
MGLMGLGMGAVWPTLVAIVGARFRESSGAAVGIMVAAGGLGVPFIQPIVGWLSNPQLLGLRYTLAALGVFTVVNLVLLRWIREPADASGPAAAGSGTVGR